MNLVENIEFKEKWNKKYNVSLSLKELQMLHDAVIQIPFADVQNVEELEYDTRDIFNIGDFNKMTNDLIIILRQLDGITNEWE